MVHVRFRMRTCRDLACAHMGTRLAKRRGIPCSLAHARRTGEWEGHDEREEQAREEEGEARRSHTTGAFLSTACHGPSICPSLRPPLLEVAHRAGMSLRACIICMTSFPEKSSDESWKHYTIQGLREARAQGVSVCETRSASAIRVLRAAQGQIPLEWLADLPTGILV